MLQQASSVRWCHLAGQPSLAPVTRVQTRWEPHSSRSCRVASAPKLCKRSSTWSTATVKSWISSLAVCSSSTDTNYPTNTTEHLLISAKLQGRHRSIHSSHIACFCKSTSSSSNYNHSITITIRTIWSNNCNKSKKVQFHRYLPSLCPTTRQAQMWDRAHRQVMPSNPHSTPHRQSHKMQTTTLLINKNELQHKVTTEVVYLNINIMHALKANTVIKRIRRGPHTTLRASWAYMTAT